MWITTDQAAEMYARFCERVTASTQKKVVEAKAAELRMLGDTDGERVWVKVKRQIAMQASH